MEVLFCCLLALKADADSAPAIPDCESRALREVLARGVAVNDQIEVMVEISAGSQEKWEYSYDDQTLKQDILNGVPRVIDYLGYPANYGFITKTLLAAEHGGDGDPVDVVLLGTPVVRGHMLFADVIGALDYLDAGEIDTKVLAVQHVGPFAGIQEIDELDLKYPGVMNIISTWFENYKLDSSAAIRGYLDRASTRKIIEKAERDYARASDGCVPHKR